MFISGIITIKTKIIERKFKTIIVIILLFGIGFNVYYLIRILIFACFAPVYNFITMIFIYLSFVLIIIQKHQNGKTN